MVSLNDIEKLIQEKQEELNNLQTKKDNLQQELEQVIQNIARVEDMLSWLNEQKMQILSQQ